MSEVYRQLFRQCLYLHCELVHPVPGEHGVRVPVHEAGQDTLAGAVDDLCKVVVARGILGGDLVGLSHILNDSAEVPKNGGG